MPDRPPPLNGDVSRHGDAMPWRVALRRAGAALEFALDIVLALVASRLAFWSTAAAVGKWPPLRAFVDALEAEALLAVLIAPAVLAAIAAWSVARWWRRVWR